MERIAFLKKALSLTPRRDPEEEQRIFSTYSGSELFVKTMEYISKKEKLDYDLYEIEWQKMMVQRYNHDPYKATDEEAQGFRPPDSEVQD